MLSLLYSRMAVKKLLVAAATLCTTFLVWTLFFYNPKNKGFESRFFSPIFDHLVHTPTLRDTYDDSAAVQVFTDSDLLLDKIYLDGCVPVPEFTLHTLKLQHAKYVDFLRSKDNKVDAYALVSKESWKWNEYKGRSGIVYIGGGKFSWLSYLSIAQLRRTGSNVPVELFIPSVEEYEERFCTHVLPRYNAKCVLFDNPSFEGLNIGGYQYKMLALMMSSFENTLYMDSDVFPLVNIDYLFESDLYKRHGLVLWPDAWARTTSPKFYEIAGVDVVEKKVRYSTAETNAINDHKPVAPLEDGNFYNSNYHSFQNTIPDPTIEAGVILVNKTSHVHTLQLALYYNVLGPDFYYPLLTQGSAGEGDKETFNAAAFVLGEKYYVCSKPFSWLGYNSIEAEEFVAKGLAIHDPIQVESDPTKERFLFIHCSYPKYYPDNIVGEVKYRNGDDIRLYEGLYNSVGYDVDLRLQEIFAEKFCENYCPSVLSPYYQNDEWAAPFLQYAQSQTDSLPGVCQYVFLPHLQWLRDTTKYPHTNELMSR